MTAQLSREELRSLALKKVKSLKFAISQSAFTNILRKLEEELQLAELALAGMDSEPVAYIGKQMLESLCDEGGRTCGRVWRSDTDELSGESRIPLYTVQPAPVMPGELHPDTQKLVADFCAALAEKLYKAQLKYGYDADWKQDGWPSQCQAHFHQHIAKGDPRDVAAYCAFMWYHGWKTKPAPGAVPDVGEFRIFTQAGGVKVAVKDGKTKNHLFGMGWNACRAATFKAGPVTGWIKCSERMPPSKTAVIVGCWFGRNWATKWATYLPGHEDAQKSGFLMPGGSWTPTHWMPLPAAPEQE